MNVGAIVLAAGSSSRMGSPKQLIKIGTHNLLNRTLDAASDSGCNHIAVVLGANAEELRAEVTNPAVQVIINPDWSEGLGSSIRTGVNAVCTLLGDNVDSVLLLLCDQPLVDSSVLQRLLRSHLETKAEIVASSYEVDGERVVGVPAIFSRSMFSKLTSLGGAMGAKQIIEAEYGAVYLVDVPEAAIDLDTFDDVKRFQASTP